MGFSTIALCLTFVLFGCVRGSDDCELCHEYVEKLTPQYCSSEKKFVVGLSQVSWFQAVENCEMSGYKLASITSKNDTDNLMKYIEKIGKKNNLFWLGATDLLKEGEFVWWTSPATPLQEYKNWYPGGGEPNNADDNEDCMLLEPKGTWNDRHCYTNLLYVCEYYLSI